MKLSDYFQGKEGLGVLATADNEGRVDTAVYSIPHVSDDNKIAFIMRERLTHENLRHNPYANYMFVEAGGRYQGVRLFLKKIKEDNDPELIASMTRRCLTPEEDKAKGPKFMVYFRVNKILPLVGSGEAPVSLD